MPDFSFLLGAQPIQTPNPLQMAGQALTLGNLATQNQLGQLNIQKMTGMVAAMQDPQVLAAYSQLFSTGGQGQPGQPGPDLSAFAKYGLGGQELLGQAVATAEKGATMRKAVADAGKATEETRNMELQNIQRMADAGAPPQVIAQRLAAAGSDPSQFFDPNNPGAFVSSVAAQLQDPKVRADILKSQVENWNTVATQQRAYAEANKPQIVGNEGVYQGIRPFGNQGPQMPPPPAGALGGAPPQGTAQAPPPIWTGTGAPSAAALQDAGVTSMPAGNAAGPIAPANTDITKGAVQVGPTFQAKQDIQTAQKEAEDINAKASAAAQIKSLVLEQRNRDANGMLTGQVMGQEWFQKLANTFAPWLSKDDYNTLSNSQAWTKQTNQIIALAVKQFAGARIAAREIPFFAGAKVDATQTDAGREMTYGDMYRIADQTQQLKSQMDQYQPPPGRGGLVGFTPKLTESQLPPIQLAAPNGKVYPVPNLMEVPKVKSFFDSVNPAIIQPGIPQ